MNLSYKSMRNFSPAKFITLRNCFFILCLIGCFLQVRKLVRIYENFDHITRVTIETRTETIVPDFSMCFEPMSLIDPDKLFKHQPEFAASIGVHDTESWLKMLQTNGSTLNYLLTGNLTIKQITDLLYETGRFIESVELSVGSRKPVLDLCKVKRFYNAGHTCILLQFNHSKSQELDPQFELKNNKNFLARISLQQGIAKHIPRVFSTLVEPDTLPWDHKATWVNLPLQQEPSRIPIDFRTMKNEYLPHPYRAQCITYSNLGYKSQAAARSECLNRLSIKLLGNPFHSAIYEANLDMYIGSSAFEKNQANKTYVKTIGQIVVECYKKYNKKDCIKTAILIEVKPPIHAKENSTIQLEFPKGPNIFIRQEPASTLTELMISVASITTSWFGISLTVQIQKIVSTVAALTNAIRKKKKLVNESKVEYFDEQNNKKSLAPKRLVSNRKMFERRDYTNRLYILAYQGLIHERQAAESFGKFNHPFHYLEQDVTRKMKRRESLKNQQDFTNH